MLLYHGVIDGLLIDERDAPCELKIPFATADTLMVSLGDRARVAKAVLDLAAMLGNK